MPSFRYTAIAASGEITEGLLDAPDERTLIEQLRRQGSIPMRARPADQGSFLSQLLRAEFGRGRALSGSEVAHFTRELSVMLGAGQDLDRALRFLVDTAPNARVRTILTEIRDAVRDGSPLAAALARQPRSFPRLYLGLVRAGEAGGMLAPTLDRLAALLERQRALRSTVISALVYPAILLLAGTGAIVLLLTQVLPQFVPLFQQNGAHLPAATQMLISTGDAVSAYGLWFLLALVVLGAALRVALRRPAVRLRADRWLLRVPLMGSLSREFLAARFARTLGTLVQNGVPLVGALGIVQEVLGNAAGIAAVREATESAKGGAGLARPLQLSGIFPVRMVYLIRLGEETAQLGPMAIRAAEIHEEQTRIRVERMVALLVPVLIIVMGGAVAAIVSSLLLAMLSLNDLAQ
jgi:general secretion pathway protein F